MKSIIESARIAPDAAHPPGASCISPSWFGPRTPIGIRARLASAGVALVCAAVLLAAAMLVPDPRGYGTHERLGLPPCGFVLRTGLPCPTCGMTTAFAQLVHGHVIAALVVQPAGAALCLGTGVLMFIAARATVSGTIPNFNWDRLGPVRAALAFALLLLGGWAFKLGHGLVTGALPAKP